MTRLTIFLFFLLFIFSVHAQDTPALLKLKSEIKNMSQDPLFKFGQIGFSLRSPEGKVLHDFNGDKSLIPASNLKLLTTATAVKILGEDFRFETKLSYDGVIKDGVLNGNLYIEGGGDPTLGSERIRGNPTMDQLFALWKEKIQQAGISKIIGSIIPIDTIFQKNIVPDGWIWTDIGNYYGAGASGLTINENLYKLTFKPGKLVGEPTQVLRTDPLLTDVQFDNQVMTGPPGSGDNAYIYGGPYSSYRYIRGTIPAGVSEFTIKGSISDPPYLCAQLLYDYLRFQGIEITKAPSKSSESLKISSVSTAKTLIYVHKSPELTEIIKCTNFFSINLYAEALLNRIAVKKGLSGEAKNGIKVLIDYWKAKGLDPSGMFLYDGSGLSPQTAIRPTQMTYMLNLMAEDSAFYSSIPVAGQSGTLWKFCKGTKAEKKIIAKSGTLSKVVCYSGYVISKNGKLNSFSIFINNYNGANSAVVSRLEKIMVLLTEL